MMTGNKALGHASTMLLTGNLTESIMNHSPFLPPGSRILELGIWFAAKPQTLLRP